MKLLRGITELRERWAGMANPVLRVAEERIIEKGAIWGASWQDGTYSDEEVEQRLRRAVDHLFNAIDNERHGTVRQEEVYKRAADVVNQTFMAADPLRVATDGAET